MIGEELLRKVTEVEREMACFIVYYKLQKTVQPFSILKHPEDRKWFKEDDKENLYE